MLPRREIVSDFFIALEFILRESYVRTLRRSLFLRILHELMQDRSSLLGISTFDGFKRLIVVYVT